jgi:hypothetical protein
VALVAHSICATHKKKNAPPIAIFPLVCATKAEATIHALTVVDHNCEISPVVLDLLELQDLEEAQQLSLSLNALSGTQDGDTVRIRALINNQVMLLLVDTGSSHSFVSAAFADRVSCNMTPIPPVSVRVANNELMHCTHMVPNFEWWVNGDTFSHDMRVLPLGAYDAILGMDWLKLHGDMTCNWEKKTLQFLHKGKLVTLQGVQSAPLTQVTEASIDQVMKWSMGMKCGH